VEAEAVEAEAEQADVVAEAVPAGTKEEVEEQCRRSQRMLS
jgi:hypothetical protein